VVLSWYSVFFQLKTGRHDIAEILLKVALNIKTGRHDIAEILLKVALSTTNQIITFLSTLDTGYQEALYLR